MDSYVPILAPILNALWWFDIVRLVFINVHIRTRRKMANVEASRGGRH